MDIIFYMIVGGMGIIAGVIVGIFYSRKSTDSKANLIIKDAKQNAENIIQNANVQAESIKKESEDIDSSWHSICINICPYFRLAIRHK